MLTPFRLIEPSTLGEVQDALLAHGPSARLLAGGTGLLPNLEIQRVTAAVVVALPALPELRGLWVGASGGLWLGALVTLAELSQSPLVRARWPILSDTAVQMATPSVRQLATVGGNLCGGLPAADLVVALLALDAEVEIHGPSGARVAALDQWLAPWGDPRLQPGEVLVGVRVPPLAGRAVYQRFSVRAAADVALANVAVRVECVAGLVTDARIVVGAHGPRPARALPAERLLKGNDGDPTQVAWAAADWVCLPDDRHASRAYRQALVRVLVARALAETARPV